MRTSPLINTNYGNADYHTSYKFILRFAKDDLERLYAALAIPEAYTCGQGTKATGMEALMILLRRLSYPNRLSDLVQLFGRSQSELSLIFNTVSKHLSM